MLGIRWYGCCHGGARGRVIVGSGRVWRCVGWWVSAAGEIREDQGSAHFSFGVIGGWAVSKWVTMRGLGWARSRSRSRWW